MTRKIIWAEDDFYVRKSIIPLLEGILQPDIMLDVVTDGTDLVEKMRSGGYSLAITDGSMPSMNGPEAIRAIRGFDKETPIYLLTGNRYSPKEVESMGANGLVDKARFEDIQKELTKILKAHSLAR